MQACLHMYEKLFVELKFYAYHSHMYYNIHYLKIRLDKYSFIINNYSTYITTIIQRLTCAWTRLASSIKTISDSKICAAISKSNGTVDRLSNTIGCYMARWYCNTLRSHVNARIHGYIRTYVHKSNRCSLFYLLLICITYLRNLVQYSQPHRCDY